jgi:hypothetical protein
VPDKASHLCRCIFRGGSLASCLHKYIFRDGSALLAISKNDEIFRGSWVTPAAFKDPFVEIG